MTTFPTLPHCLLPPSLHQQQRYTPTPPPPTPNTLSAPHNQQPQLPPPISSTPCTTLPMKHQQTTTTHPCHPTYKHNPAPRYTTLTTNGKKYFNTTYTPPIPTYHHIASHPIQHPHLNKASFTTHKTIPSATSSTPPPTTYAFGATTPTHYPPSTISLNFTNCATTSTTTTSKSYVCRKSTWIYLK